MKICFDNTVSTKIPEKGQSSSHQSFCARKSENPADHQLKVNKMASVSCRWLAAVTVVSLVCRGAATCAYGAIDSNGHAVIPDGDVTITAEAFRDCAALRSIYIPDTVVTIETYVFAGCENLASVDIPSTVHTIGAYAFAYSGLTTLDIPSYTGTGAGTTIATYAFAYTPMLVSVNIPSSVVTVGAYAFAYSGVASVCIDSVTTLATCT